MRKSINVAIPVITVGMWVFWITLGRNFPAAYVSLTNESRGVELLTAIVYLVSGVLLLKAYAFSEVPLLRRACPLLLGLFFIFVAGEEESWGMWIFDFSAPESIKAINTQGEITIHNLSLFSGLLAPRRILDAFVLMFGVVIPLLRLYHDRLRRLLTDLHIPVGPTILSIWFLAGLAYERLGAAAVDSEYIEPWRHTEVSEFVFAVGFFLIIAFHFYGKRLGQGNH